jgi:hypothetical protein
MAKPKIATTSLAGCFGCHMSLLDIDERILDLAELVDFDKSPIDDIKKFTGRCAVGLIEGGCSNEENVEVLREFRKHCDVLISVGDCAIMGGIPALRNMVPLQECLNEAYIDGPTVYNPSGKVPTTRRTSPCCSTRSIPATRWSRSTTTCPAARPRGHPLGSARRAAQRQTARPALPTHQVRLISTGVNHHGAYHQYHRVVIEPVTRVEGHGKVTIHLNEDNTVQQARLHIVEFRGFERFIQGRPFWEMPVAVQRLCGICPVSHHLCAAKASTGSSAGRNSPPPPRRCAG